MQGYRATNWFQFRQQVIELDDKACVRCGKSLANGAKLQVHHKRGGFKSEVQHRVESS